MRIIRSINIDENIWEMLDKLAKKHGRSKSNMIEYLILDYMRRDKNVK